MRAARSLNYNRGEYLTLSGNAWFPRSGTPWALDNDAYSGAFTPASFRQSWSGSAGALIDLDTTARGRLHDRWSRQDLALRMACLIFAGGLLSYLKRSVSTREGKLLPRWG
jgi:hypothetical protein